MTTKEEQQDCAADLANYKQSCAKDSLIKLLSMEAGIIKRCVDNNIGVAWLEMWHILQSQIEKRLDQGAGK